MVTAVVTIAACDAAAGNAAADIASVCIRAFTLNEFLRSTAASALQMW